MKAGNKKDNQLELEVEAKLENLAVIDDFITESLNKLGIRKDETLQVQLAVSEACTNIIQHAYSGESEESIILLCSMSGNDLVIVIKDWGESFDPNTVPQPDIESELVERKEGGVGIFLMRQMMNDVRYAFQPGGQNELRMIKHIPQEG
jgi:anti-sigma regulatory factor (Ser/Thr protein kinase)